MFRRTRWRNLGRRSRAESQALSLLFDRVPVSSFFLFFPLYFFSFYSPPFFHFCRESLAGNNNREREVRKNPANRFNETEQCWYTVDRCVRFCLPVMANAMIERYDLKSKNSRFLGIPSRGLNISYGSGIIYEEKEVISLSSSLRALGVVNNFGTYLCHRVKDIRRISST